MPSQLHEALIELFRNRPELAPELLRMALDVDLPHYTEARIESADLTDLQPAEYRTDLVVLLVDGKPVMGIVVEVQLARDDRKPFVWPVYCAGLRARIRCDVVVLVVTPDDTVARWAARPITLGGSNSFLPLVLGPSGVPVVTDIDMAKADPELAVLSALAHGRDPDEAQALQVAVAALAASAGLDPAEGMLYCDLVMASLSEAVRRNLQAMDLATYEFHSDFAKRFLAEGRAEGLLQGQAALVLRLLTRRFGDLPEAAVAQVRGATSEQLELFADRVLTAETLEEVLA